MSRSCMPTGSMSISSIWKVEVGGPEVQSQSETPETLSPKTQSSNRAQGIVLYTAKWAGIDTANSIKMHYINCQRINLPNFKQKRPSTTQKGIKNLW